MGGMPILAAVVVVPTDTKTPVSAEDEARGDKALRGLLLQPDKMNMIETTPSRSNRVAKAVNSG